MRFPYWRGALYGFLFGTIGLALLAMLALVSRFFEAIGEVLFAPTRLLAPDNGTTMISILLFAASGILYAAVGVLIEYIYRRVRT